MQSLLAFRQVMINARNDPWPITHSTNTGPVPFLSRRPLGVRKRRRMEHTVGMSAVISGLGVIFDGRLLDGAFANPHAVREDGPFAVALL